MPSNAQKVINYINAGNPVLAQMGQAVYPWPASDGFTNAEAVTMIDIYHDLVANKGFDLPNTPENTKKITAEMRRILGYPKAEGAGLRPTLVVKTLAEKVNTGIGADLYEWVFPKRITYTPEVSVWKEILPSTENPLSKGLSDIKWIVLAGLAGYVLVSTGILSRLKK